MISGKEISLCAIFCKRKLKGSRVRVDCTAQWDNKSARKKSFGYKVSASDSGFFKLTESIFMCKHQNESSTETLGLRRESEGCPSRIQKRAISLAESRSLYWRSGQRKVLFAHSDWLAQKKVITQANQKTSARGFVIAQQVQFSAQVLLLLVYCLLQLSSSELNDNQYRENIYRERFPYL